MSRLRMLRLVELLGGLVRGRCYCPSDSRLPPVGTLRLSCSGLTTGFLQFPTRLRRLVPLHHAPQLLRRLHPAHPLPPNSLMRLQDVHSALAFPQLPGPLTETFLFDQVALSRLLPMKVIEQPRLIVRLAIDSSRSIEKAERRAPGFSIVVGDVGVHTG